MTILSNRSDKRRRRRADSRTSKQNKLFWAEGPESQRLEARTLLTLTVTTFSIPLVALVQPDGITTGADGKLWFAETAAYKIGRMTPAGVVTEFPLPATTLPAGSSGSPPGPTAITAGPDGALWFTETSINPNAAANTVAIGRITPQGPDQDIPRKTPGERPSVAGKHHAWP